jgi:hypothetical protein
MQKVLPHLVMVTRRGNGASHLCQKPRIGQNIHNCPSEAEVLQQNLSIKMPSGRSIILAHWLTTSSLRPQWGLICLVITGSEVPTFEGIKRYRLAAMRCEGTRAPDNIWLMVVTLLSFILKSSPFSVGPNLDLVCVTLTFNWKTFNYQNHLFIRHYIGLSLSRPKQAGVVHIRRVMFKT